MSEGEEHMRNAVSPKVCVEIFDQFDYGTNIGPPALRKRIANGLGFTMGEWQYNETLSLVGHTFIVANACARINNVIKRRYQACLLDVFIET